MAGRKAGQGSKWIRPAKRLAIYLRDGACCVYCGRGVEMGAVLTLDHVTACHLGGTNEAGNLVTCCRCCNSSKRDLTTRRWYAVLRSRGFDTAQVGRKVRAMTRRDLTSHLVAAKSLIASVDCDAPSVGHLAVAQ